MDTHQTGDQTLRQRQILVADDNAINLYFFSTVLEKEGVKVSPCEDGQATLKALKQQRFDLVVLDLQMPCVSGLEIITQLRNGTHEKNQHCPIIAISAHLDTERINEVLAGGADACLLKPVRGSEFIQQCQNCLTGKANTSDSQQTPTVAVDRIWHQQKAMAITGGDRDVMKQMLTMFLQQLEPAQKEVEQLIGNKHYELAMAKVHRIQGSARFCATPALANASAALYATLSQSVDAPIQSKLAAFKSEIRRLQKLVDAKYLKEPAATIRLR
jgi:two-component system sensor histidine kinase BarA